VRSANRDAAAHTTLVSVVVVVVVLLLPLQLRLLRLLQPGLLVLSFHLPVRLARRFEFR